MGVISLLFGTWSLFLVICYFAFVWLYVQLLFFWVSIVAFLVYFSSF
jgi:hypothetical protein